jgi:hypothetical protein
MVEQHRGQSDSESGAQPGLNEFNRCKELNEQAALNRIAMRWRCKSRLRSCSVSQRWSDWTAKGCKPPEDMWYPPMSIGVAQG